MRGYADIKTGDRTTKQTDARTRTSRRRTYNFETVKNNSQVSEQLLRVMDQVRTIKESTQVTNGLLMDRIEDAFSDIQR